MTSCQLFSTLIHCPYLCSSAGGLSQLADLIHFSLSRELAELHKANATKDSEAQELALSREVQAKEELSLALEKVQEESRLQQEALANQVIYIFFVSFVKMLIYIFM